MWYEKNAFCGFGGFDSVHGADDDGSGVGGGDRKRPNRNVE